MVSNEGKVCDAVLRLLEERSGRVRAKVRHPEKDHIGPPVDLAFELGGQQYAFEHTIIQAYPEQIPMGMHFKTLIDPVVKALDGKLPKPGVYSLAAPLRVHLGDKKLLKQAQAAIINWVQEMAAELHAEAPVRRDRRHDPNGRRGTRTQQPSGLPFELKLSRRVHWRESGKHDGRLFVGRFAPPDEELLSQRRERMTLTLEKKCSKLQKCRDSGARTVLILEMQDHATSNHIDIIKAAEEVLETRTDGPDEIYVVDTTCEEWTICAMKTEAGVGYPDTFIHFESIELIDLESQVR